MYKESKINPTTVCTAPIRFPYVCNGCAKRYIYEPTYAQNIAQQRLVSSRVGINLTPEQFNQLDTLIKQGVERKIPSTIS